MVLLFFTQNLKLSPILLLYFRSIHGLPFLKALTSGQASKLYTVKFCPQAGGPFGALASKEKRDGGVVQSLENKSSYIEVRRIKS